MIDSEAMLVGSFQVTVSRDLLAERTALVARGLSSRASVLVLGGIRLAGDGEELTLAATDMEISLRAALAAQVGAPGEVVVPGRLLLDIVRALPGEDAVLEYRPEESVLAITS